MRRGHVLIEVSEKTYKTLVAKKKELNAKTWNEFFTYLLDEYNACVELEREKLVKKVVCNDHRETRAALPAWGKILANKLQDASLLAKALNYLKIDPATGDYVVDEEKCME